MIKTRERVTIEVEPGSELAQALDVVDEKMIVLTSNGRQYVIERAPLDPGSRSDAEAEAFREALRAVVGTLTPEEGEQLKGRWR